MNSPFLNLLLYSALILLFCKIEGIHKNQISFFDSLMTEFIIELGSWRFNDRTSGRAVAFKDVIGYSQQSQSRSSSQRWSICPLAAAVFTTFLLRISPKIIYVILITLFSCQNNDNIYVISVLRLGDTDLVKDLHTNTFKLKHIFFVFHSNDIPQVIKFRMMFLLVKNNNNNKMK